MRSRLAVSYPASGGNPLKHDLFGSLSWATVTLLDPDREHPTLATEALDLYHMARRTSASLADLARADRAGVRTVNPAAAARLTSDRVERHRVLSEAGFAVPEFRYGTADVVDLDPPVVVKSRLEAGWDTHVFEVVREPPVSFSGERVVERVVPHDRSLKLFRVGDAVRTAEVRGEPFASHLAGGSATATYVEVETPDRLRRLVERVAAATDLRLFETDVLVGDRDWVLDVNPVVSLRGVADGKRIYERLLRRRAENGDGERG